MLETRAGTTEAARVSRTFELTTLVRDAHEQLNFDWQFDAHISVAHLGSFSLSRALKHILYFFNRLCVQSSWLKVKINLLILAYAFPISVLYTG